MKALQTIQQKLVAPKGQYNSFGKYRYRSCEDILQAVKPLLAETETTLTISDEMVEIGGRVYVKATATLSTIDGKQSISTTAYARESESRAGMDASQITGSASSYARKYALNGLFAIDDTKDADATNTHGKSAAPAQPQPAPAGLKEAIDDLLTTSTDRKSFEAAMRRHKEFIKVEAFAMECAKLSARYPKTKKVQA